MLLDAQAPPQWSNNLINGLKYYALQLGDPTPIPNVAQCASTGMPRVREVFIRPVTCEDRRPNGDDAVLGDTSSRILVVGEARRLWTPLGDTERPLWFSGAENRSKAVGTDGLLAVRTRPT